MKIHLLIAFLISSLSLFGQAGYPVEIQVLVPPPYPHALESYVEYEDQLTVVISNMSETEEYSVKFHFSIVGDNGVSIITREDYVPAVPFILGPGQVETYTGRELEDIGISIDRRDLIEVGIDPAVYENRMLPVGSYMLCVTAYDFFTSEQLSQGEPAGCASLFIEYPDAPELIDPEYEEVIPSEIEDVSVTWIPPTITNPVLLERTEYRVRVVDMTLSGQENPTEALDHITGTPLVDEMTPTPGIFLIQDVNWVEGHQYAIRVTAIDPEGEFIFLNNGHSNAHAFHYGHIPAGTPCSNPGDYAMEPHFPKAGDTIPFTFFPLVGGFTPYCDDYWRLDFSASCTDGTNNPGQQNPWPDGPLVYLENTFGVGPSATWEHASKFAFADVQSTVTRGQAYSWEATTSMNMRDGRNWSSNIPSQEFIVGMPTSQHRYPESNASIPPGDINFRWLTGGSQDRIVPEFKLFHIQEYVAMEARLGDVHEKWSLQVFNASTPSSSALVRHTDAVLDVSADNFYDWTTRRFDQAQIESELLKELDHSFNITDEGDYWWRMVWVKDPDQTVTGWIPEAEIYHASSMRKFTIDASATPSTPEEGEEPTCNAPCTFPTITDRTAVGGLEVGATFTVGGFEAEVEAITSSSSNRFSGRCIVEIAYLNNIRVRMDMNDIQINAASQAFSGNLTPVIDQTYAFSQVVTPLGTAIGMSSEEAEALDAGLAATGKLISFLSGNTINLPVGIDKTIDGNRIVIGIMDIRISPTDAKMKAVVNIALPNFEMVDEIFEGLISMGAEVCISPTGISDEGKLFLPSDRVFDFTQGNEFRLAGAESGRSMEEVTYVSWDCEGFKELNLASIFKFTRDWILPENPDGTIPEEGNVEARVSGKFTRGGNFMARMDMDPFQIPGVEKWSFTVANEAWIDLSDLENPSGLQAALPDDYTHASMQSSGMERTWKGFWLKEVSVRTPEVLQGEDGARLSFALRNMIIDNSGISFSARAENILSWEEEEGSMSGWKASLDTIYFDIAQNNFRAIGFNGKLGLPITEQTQYLNYSAELVHRADSFAFVINVAPRENLSIPISMATATIDRSSYVKIEISNNSFIEANLTGSLSLSDGNLPSGSSMPSSLNMSGLRIQNFRVNSNTGFDDSQFSYSLASPQKTMSGFPISLETFAISNEGIIVEPKLTLASGNDGFAAAAKITLLLDIDLAASPQRFDLTGVQLNSITLDVTTSDVSLHGRLEFYKRTEGGVEDKGVEGSLALGLNLGTKVNIEINAKFGTVKSETATVYDRADWFSYFYVDGMAIIGEGIQIFSGLSLYGIGGGFYHHMSPREGTSLPEGSDVLEAGSGAGSGIQYDPDYLTDLGLKFTVILGSNGDQGKAYNLDVTLEARFSFDHGLTYIGFEGSFRVMTDGVSIETVGLPASNCPIAGYVGMELNLPPFGDPVFDGQFFVQVQVPPGEYAILKGLGEIPNPPDGWSSENTMVWAQFHIDPHEWYFHMGRPEWGQRGGLSLEIGGESLAEVSSYLMIGHGIPTTLPAPHAEFIRIYNLGLDNPEQSVAGGNVDDLLVGQPREGTESAVTGTGFAFGIAMMFNMNMQFPPFYFDLTAVMGADINVTQSFTRTCAGTGRAPGVDGWYGTGQMYAAIEGEFGVGIDLIFIKGQFPILSASAALLLEGGLPNPEWARGTGSFHYSILNDLITGRCSFEFTVGEVCFPVETGSPFGDLTLIQDLKPSDNARDVSVFVKPQASFSLPMNEVIEVSVYDSNVDPPEIWYYYPYIHDFKIKPFGSSMDSLPGSRRMREENYISEMLPDQALNGNSHYELYLEARARVLNSGSGSWEDVYMGGEPFKETRLHDFWTGKAPDHLVDNNIWFTYPYINQQTFLKDETIDHTGYVRLVQGRPDILSDMGEFEVNDVAFYARFSSENGDEFESPLTISNGYRLLKFENLQQLDNSTTYCIQLIRKDVPPNAVTVHLDQDMINAMEAGPELNNLQQIVMTNYFESIGESTFSSETIREIDLPADNAKPFESVIYAYYFRTSNHNTLKAKLNAGENWVSDHAEIGLIKVPNIEKVLDENFEWVDLESFKVVNHDYAKQFSKRAKVFLRKSLNDEFDPFRHESFDVNSYIRYRVRPNTSTLHAHLLTISNRLKRDYPLLAGQFGNVPYIPYRNYTEFLYFDSSAPRHRPLTESEINYAFGGSSGGGSFSGSSFYAQSGMYSLGFNFSGLNLSVPKTRFNYDINFSGLIQYDKWQRRMAGYAFRTIYTLWSFMSYPELIDFMSPSERSWMEYHLDQYPANRMRLNNGYHTVGIYYTYPDPYGYDRKGSIHPMRFYQ